MSKMIKKRRYRVVPTPKLGSIKVQYGKCESHDDPDLVYIFNGTGMRPDMNLVMCAFENTNVVDKKSLRKELEERGYDITTLKFSIQKKEGWVGS